MACRLYLVLAIICAFVLVSNAASLQKRDTESEQKPTVNSDASVALDKIFEDINKGMKKLAQDGVDINTIVGKISQQATKFGEQMHTLGKEIGEKVQQAAKEQGIAT